MRRDMDSLNPGKAMAQAAHAANAAVDFLERHDPMALNEWRKECKTFGTTIVLGVNSFDELHEVIYDFPYSGEVLDPTYPINDGQVTHLIPVTTCGWVFAKRDYWKSRVITQNLDLHP